MRTQRFRRLLGRLLAGVMFVGVALPVAAHAATSTIYVDKNNPSCANSGTGVGTQTKPYCAINPAAQVAVAGQTVQVASGTYTEAVSPRYSGVSGSPIVYQSAPGALVTITGGADGFKIDTKSWISVVGFTITGTTSYGIFLRSSTNITISNNHVSYSGQPTSTAFASGINVHGTNNSLISGNTSDHNTDSGIYLNSGSTGDEIKGNITFANARQYTRAAPGIDIRTPGNTIDGNISHDNEDSGIQLYNGGNNSVVYDNLAYNNGDHGIDCLNSTGAVIVSNTVFGSRTAGINLEGASGTSASSGGTVENNISVDNGLTNTTGTKGNIRVDVNSIPGTTVNYDLVWLSSPGKMMTWGNNGYASLSAFTAASGQETHGLQADPAWKDPSNGDFHLTSASPAIDSADSGAPNQPSADIEGLGRVDDAAVPNTGAGPRAYDDRGAYEFPESAPSAALSVTPNSGYAPLNVTADATASTDADATPIATYTFDFGDGTAVVGPQAGATAPHTYAAPGSYTVTVTVTDTAGLSSTATKTVTANPDSAPSAALSVTPNSGYAPLNVTADATASTDADATPIATYTFDFGDGTAVVGPQAGATAPHTYAAPGSYTVTVTVTDTAGLSSTATKTVTANPDSAPSAALSVTPNSGYAPLNVTADATASTDADATPIATYTFDFGDGTAVVGPQAGATAPHTYAAPGSYTVTVTVTDTAGLSSTATKTVTANPDSAPSAALSVTPNSGYAPLNVTADATASTDADATPIATYTFDFGDGTAVVGPQAGATAPHTYAAPGSYTVTVTVTDTAGLSSTATKTVTVSTALTNLIGNPGFESSMKGWNAGGRAGVTFAQSPGGHSGSYSAVITNTNSTTVTECTLNDSPNWVSSTVPGTYQASIWVRADSPGATLKLRIREYTSSGSFVNSASTTVTLSTTWQQVSLSYSVTATGNNLDFTPYITSAPPGVCFYADDASITHP